MVGDFISQIFSLILEAQAKCKQESLDIVSGVNILSFERRMKDRSSEVSQTKYQAGFRVLLRRQIIHSTNLIKLRINVRKLLLK